MCCGRQARMPRTSMPPSPGNCRSSRAVWMMPAIVGGTSLAASQTCAKRNHSRGQLRELVDARIRAPEVQHVDEDAGVGPVDRAHDLVAVARLPVSVQCGNSRLTKMPSGFARSHSRAKRSVARSRSGSGSCAMTCCAPSSAVASSSGMKSSGSSFGSMRNSSPSLTATPVAASRALVSRISALSRARSYSTSSGVTRVMRRPT